MLIFSITMPGLPALQVGLDRLRHDITDWTSFWTDSFAPLFYREMVDQFVSEGALTGDRWAPLSPAYEIWKRKHFPGAGILMRSGQLKDSLMGSDAPGAIFRATSDSLEIGTSVGHGRYHQLGTRRLPQRPPLRVDQAFVTNIGRSLNKYVEKTWQSRLAASAGAPAAA